MSNFIRLIQDRIENRNKDIAGDNVPWHLDDKYNAFQFAKSLGWKTPAHYKFRHKEEAIEAGEKLGRFVLKEPHHYLSKGVRVLEPLGEGEYLDIARCRIVTKEDIKPAGEEPDYWLAEEFLPPAYGYAGLPLDYKIYAFRGRITHIFQIDRTAFPLRIAGFDGNFLPLRLGKEFGVKPEVYRPQGHLIPLHAAEMLTMAASLSREINTSFVRIDCYDTPSGAVFGEFTFTPGSESVGNIHYPPGILTELDRALDDPSSVGSLSGFDIDQNSLYEAASAAPVKTYECPQVLLPLIAERAIKYDLRFTRKVEKFATDSLLGQHFAFSSQLIGVLNGDVTQAAPVAAAIRFRAGFISGDRRLDQFIDILKRLEKRLGSKLKTQA